MSSCISADKFVWHGKHARAMRSHLNNFFPTSFHMKSPKTNVVKYFDLDRESAGYEDHWDGEFRMYVDESKEYSVLIENY